MATKRNVGTLKEADLKGKSVFVRVDLNVPLDDNSNITDDTRIRAAVPTIKYLMGNGSRVVLCSHLGRPKGVTPKFSLKPLVPRLSELLGIEVVMANDSIGEEVQKLVAALPEGGVLLLENVRFYKEEEKNDPEFAKKLAALADLYVNDAFGTAHRAHASTEGVAKYLKPSVAGFLMQKELDYLVGAVANPKKPFAAIVGGSKVSTKIGVIESLLSTVDILLLGGGMIYTFYKAQGHAVGSSLLEEDKLDLARSLMEKAKSKGVSLLLPTDVVIADKFAPDANSKIVPATAIPDGWMGLDIGPDSIKTFSEALDTTKTIIWNGPMGVFEFEKFAAGTEKMEAIDLNDDVMDEGTQQLEVIENSEANRGTQPRQRRKVSRLWRKFTIMGPKQSDGKTKIRCNFCKRFYFLKLRKNGTSTLTRHMKVCPKAVGTPRSTSRKVEITDLISGSSYPTSNLYFNEIWKIECWLRAHANHSDRVICEMVESMKLKFDKYWEEYSDILAIAAVLDPRLKFEILEYCFSVLDQSTCKRRLANVRSKIYRLFGAYKKSQRISSTATTSQGETPDVPAGYGGFYTFFSQKAVGSGKSAPDIYLDEPLLDYAAHKKLNVLHYWRDNSARFKELATMAREVLSIPITTVASESSFSIGSRVLNKYRSCLLPTNVQALVCTRNWLKGFPEMDDECVEKTEEEKEEEVKQEENEEESGQSIDLT